MSSNIRLPKIDGTTSAQQLSQIKGYLYQLVEQLNYTLADMETGGTRVVMTGGTSNAAAEKKNEAAASFNSIKALIIKSAEIVNAYYDEINRRLVKEYDALSDYGRFTEQATQDIKENADGIYQNFSNIQTIVTDIKNLEHKLIEVDAHIYSGLLYYDEDGVPVYGMEIGQRTEIDGKEVFNKYARFTSDRLSFYDQNDNEVAYISDTKLYIENVEIKVTYKMGGFEDKVLEADGSIVTKWIGYGGDE